MSLLVDHQALQLGYKFRMKKTADTLRVKNLVENNKINPPIFPNANPKHNSVSNRPNRFLSALIYKISNSGVNIADFSYRI